MTALTREEIDRIGEVAGSDEPGFLAPCPFCDSPAERVELDDEENCGTANLGGKVISCTGCGASSPVYFDRAENMDAEWNRHSSREAVPRLIGLEARIAELEAALTNECETSAQIVDRIADKQRQRLQDDPPIKDSMRKTVVAALESVAKAIRARAALQRGKT